MLLLNSVRLEEGFLGSVMCRIPHLNFAPISFFFQHLVTLMSLRKRLQRVLFSRGRSSVIFMIPRSFIGTLKRSFLKPWRWSSSVSCPSTLYHLQKGSESS
uniref:Uncharacterized protein n=1 Tax=Rhizophora mucronata TaxID=61149 RepID=A0A2P2QEX1_RHIMU